MPLFRAPSGSSTRGEKPYRIAAALAALLTVLSVAF